MKKIVVAILLSSFAIFGFSQERQEKCSFDRIARIKIRQAVESKIQEGIANLQQNRSSHTVKTIPIVVHVIHDGGAENISLAQIQSQIDILNEDYGKVPGTPGDGAGVDCEVQFKLAKYDPNGNCTNGVVRIESQLTYHSSVERFMLKQLSFWDNERYLNVYVVKSIAGGTLGYSSFPGGPPDEDGIVVEHDVFGNTGTASASMGRTMTHEVGHWLGLYHTFNNGCGIDVCADGDYVCDTPPVTNANFNCPTGINTCSNDVPDLQDNIENYMDYTDDACKNMFTLGQSDRMQSSLNVIRTAIWSDTNLVFTGCDSNYIAPSTCDLVTDFVTLTTDVCIGANVSFYDKSLNGATSWEWLFTGGTPSTSTLQNPIIAYNTLGSFDVRLIATDGITIDTLILNNYITVSSPGIGDPLPFSEDFESGFPSNGLSISNPDGEVQWELDSVAPYEGNYCIKINNLINTNYGTADEVIFPYFDLSTVGSTPYMKFKWAYAASDPLYSDELMVHLSVDCGSTWNQIFYRTQASLETAPWQSTPFIPDSTQWNSALVSMGMYASEQYVLLKIVNVTDGGNALYIDNINIGNNTVGVIENNVEESLFSMYPNPVNNELKLTFNEYVDGVVSLFTIEGRLINQLDISHCKYKTIDTSDLPNGLYNVQSLIENRIESKLVVVQH